MGLRGLSALARTASATNVASEVLKLGFILIKNKLTVGTYNATNDSVDYNVLYKGHADWTGPNSRPYRMPNAQAPCCVVS